MAVTVEEAAQIWPALLDKVAGDEAVVIERGGHEVAVLSKRRSHGWQPGTCEGLFEVPDAFFAPLPPEIQLHFE